jgi:chorismate mutase
LKQQKKITVSEKERQLANKWIAELTEAGYTPNDMVCIFREARRKYNDYKKRMSQLKNKK